jgi:mannose/cellobiose epimerase-like protein (N-acyl-D-glucosamine 2-epimerase family)
MAKLPFSEIRTWMFDAALPFWAAHGVDTSHGGFYEELGFDGAPTSVDFKRVRAMCRQVYVFSHAALLGWREGAQLSADGFDYVVRKAWQGPELGWAKTLSRDGIVRDSTADLYDQAFGLYAMAWRHRLSGDAEALKLARQTLEFVDTHMRDSGGAGFWSALPGGGARAQNPHMHLLEACLAAFETSAEQQFLDVANEIAALFHARFFDGRTLGEHFTTDWRRAPGEKGRVVEPGHHFEWGWLLAQHQRHTGMNSADAARALMAFAEAHGVDEESGAVFNSVRDDGAPLDRGSRTWTNCERIKGWLGLFECGGEDASPAASSARLLLERYLSVSPRGAWQDHFDAAGAPLAAIVPASTFYHVFAAFAEVLRLEPALSARG